MRQLDSWAHENLNAQRQEWLVVVQELLTMIQNNELFHWVERIECDHSRLPIEELWKSVTFSKTIREWFQRDAIQNIVKTTFDSLVEKVWLSDKFETTKKMSLFSGETMYSISQEFPLKEQSNDNNTDEYITQKLEISWDIKESRNLYKEWEGNVTLTIYYWDIL